MGLSDLPLSSPINFSQSSIYSFANQLAPSFTLQNHWMFNSISLFIFRLTAFVIKSFSQARAFIPEYIDSKMLDASLVWMSRQTNFDGSFKKVGAVHSSALKVCRSLHLMK